MNSSFKAALFLLLAGAVLAGFEDQVKKFNKDRHPFLKSFSDVSKSVAQASEEVARHINSVLALPDVQAQLDLWLNILLRKETYPFEESELNLNEAVVEERLIADVDALFDVLGSLPQEQSADEAFNSRMTALLAKTERLMKLELLHQLFGLVSKKDQIVFRGDLISHVLSHVNERESSLEDRTGFNTQAKVAELRQELQETKDRLKEYFPSVVQLLDLLRNNLFFLEKELAVLDLLAQSEVTFDQDAFLAKFDFLYTLFAQVAVQAGKKEAITGLFDSFMSDYVTAAKRGSKLGTVQFRELVPRMVGFFVRIIGNHASPAAAFKAAKDYIRAITSLNNEKPNVIQFLEQYVRHGNLPHVLLSPKGRQAEVEALKTVDIVKRVDYKHVDAGWWAEVLQHFDNVLVNVSSELLDAVENSKSAACNRLDSFDALPEYYLGLYDLLMTAIVELGPEMSNADEWVFAFIGFVQDRFTAVLHGSTGSEETRYLGKYYPLIIFHILSFRNTDEGSIHFQDFLSGDMAAANASLLKEITDKFRGHVFNGFATNLKKSPLSDGRKFSLEEQKGLAYIPYLSGKDVPIRLFKRNEVALKLVEEKKDNVGVVNTRESTNFRLQDSKVLEATKIHKAPGLTPANDFKSPVVEEQTPQLKETPANKEEPTPFQETKEVEETPANKEEPTPFQETKEVEEIPLVKEKSPEKIITPEKEEKEEKNEEEPIIPEKKDEEEPVMPEKKDEEEPVIPEKEEEDVPTDPLTKLHIPIDEVDEEEVIAKSPVTSPYKTEPIDTVSPRKKAEDGLDKTPSNKINVTPQKEEERQEMEEDTHEVEEDIIGPQMTGEPIPITPTHFHVPELTPQEKDNLIEVVKGSLDPALVEKFRKTPDLVKLVTDIQIVIDPITGDETHYYYVQLVETETSCHAEITEALEDFNE